MSLRLVSLLLGASVAGIVAVACANAPGLDSAAASDLTEGAPLVISQVYATGGTADDGFASDFVEVFNRGQSPVALKDYSLAWYPKQEKPGSGTGKTTEIFMDDAAELQPGQHFLFRLTVPGEKGKPLDAFDHQSPETTTPHTADLEPDGFVAIVPRSQAVSCLGGSESCAALDVVGFGQAARKEGSAIPSVHRDGMAFVRKNGGCQDSGDNTADFEATAPAPHTTKDEAKPCAASDAGAESDASSDAATTPSKEAGAPADAGADAAKPPPAPTPPKKPTPTTPAKDDDTADEGEVTEVETAVPAKASPKEPAKVESAAATCAMGSGPAGSGLAGGLGFGLALATLARRRRAKR